LWIYYSVNFIYTQCGVGFNEVEGGFEAFTHL
jgi:hypothetical protein